MILFAAVGLLIVAANFGPFITSLYSLGLFLGTIYSVPPLRMKRFPVAAFLIIATVWFKFSSQYLKVYIDFHHVIMLFHKLLIHKCMCVVSLYFQLTDVQIDCS